MKLEDTPLLERPLVTARITKTRVVANAVMPSDPMGLAPTLGFIRDDRFVGVAEVFSQDREAVANTLLLGISGYAATAATAVFDTRWETSDGAGDVFVYVHCTRGEEPVFTLQPYTIEFERAGVAWGEAETVQPEHLAMYGDLMQTALDSDSLIVQLDNDTTEKIKGATWDLQLACDIFTHVALEATSQAMYFPDDRNSDEEVQRIAAELIPMMGDVLTTVWK